MKPQKNQEGSPPYHSSKFRSSVALLSSVSHAGRKARVFFPNVGKIPPADEKESEPLAKKYHASAKFKGKISRA
jgi:hypothetical protein